MMSMMVAWQTDEENISEFQEGIELTTSVYAGWMLQPLNNKNCWRYGSPGFTLNSFRYLLHSLLVNEI